jgi:DNA-binding response OmpR family regulator
MLKKPMLTLIVSKPGDLQNGLLALMTTIPQLGAVLVAEDLNSAMRMIEHHQPTLIILDSASIQARELIQEIKTQWPQIHLIVLVEDIPQQKDAEGSGADSVLVKGFPAQKLVRVLENLTRNDLESY